MTEADDGSFEVQVYAPGVKPQDLTLEIEDGRMSVKGETVDVNNAKTHVVNWVVALPTSADAAHATSSLVDGILTVKLPKKEPVAPTKVTVNTTERIDSSENAKEQKNSS